MGGGEGRRLLRYTKVPLGESGREVGSRIIGGSLLGREAGYGFKQECLGRGGLEVGYIRPEQRRWGGYGIPGGLGERFGCVLEAGDGL